MAFPGMVRLSEHVFVYESTINIGVLVNPPEAILIDFGDGAAAESLQQQGIAVSHVFVTHHHRDQVYGLERRAPGPRDGKALPAGLKLLVPQSEVACFTEVERLWSDPGRRWHQYTYRPHHLLLTRSVAPSGTVKEGDEFRFGPLSVKVVETPGHTDGSVSYIVDDGGVRIAFCGDLIYDCGRVWDLYSLQKGGSFGSTTILDYHGFMGDWRRLERSLSKLLEEGCHVLVPSHGTSMRDPGEAVRELAQNLRAAYANYAATSALHFYFPEVLAGYTREVGARGGPALEPYPDWLSHIGTTWAIHSSTGALWVMDCGSRKVVEWLESQRAKGASVEGLWISHYHDDHVDGIDAFARAFDCPIYAGSEVADIIAAPRAHRLPCLSPVEARVDRLLAHGESWSWREFRLTHYAFPGQTLYHSALLVEGRGRRFLFIGDTFTPSGLDDYCAGNRNFLGEGLGMDRCLSLIEAIQPDALFNCHIDGAFRFHADDIAHMRRKLSERESILARLLPWDHPNFGVDEHWVRTRPYQQGVTAGSVCRVAVEITNHARSEKKVAARLVPPEGWACTPPSREAVIAPCEDGSLDFELLVPPGSSTGRHIVLVEVAIGDRNLGPVREAIVDVREAEGNN